ncbi:MAG: hypothetical protein M3680_05995 [Myxococcota bacterium]|nr:hypothetical protein [Myxococcota bacterium]
MKKLLIVAFVVASTVAACGGKKKSETTTTTAPAGDTTGTEAGSGMGSDAPAEDGATGTDAAGGAAGGM